MAKKLLMGVVFFVLWNNTLDAAHSFHTLLGERPPCNQTLSSLSSLQESGAKNDSWRQSYVVCVNLQPGNEYIDYSPISVDFASVIITGSASGSVVRCRDVPSTSGELGLDNYTQSPLIFTNSSLVIIEGLQFEGCQRPLQFNQVVRVEFISSSFRNFYPGGALDISNSPQVVVNNCTFTNNTSLGIGTRRFSGNAGAVAIGYDDGPKTDNLQNILPLIRITESTFTDNNSSAAEGFRYDPATVLTQRIYNQRGAGVACYLGASNYSADIEISSCTFDGNHVEDSGGAVYMFLTGQNNGHSVRIQQCKFFNNTARVGGGVELTFDTSFADVAQQLLLNQVLFEDCNFTRNTGRYGGGYSHIQLNTQENLNNLTIKTCTFIENTAPVGSAVYLQYVFTVNHVLLKKMIFVEDCTFLDNVATNGVLFASRNTVGILGNTTFRGSIGPAVQSFGSVIIFSGHVVFDRNRNHPEGFSGVLHLSAFGQIVLQSGVHMTFTNNTGVKGGAITVTGQLISAGSIRQLYNPQCFLQYQDPRAPPPTWNVVMIFENNQAEVGPIVYATNLQVCAWFNVSSPFFNSKPQDGWIFMTIKDNYLLRGGMKLSNPESNFQTVVKNFSLAESQPSSLRASPGEDVTVDVVTSDEYNHETTAFVEIKDTAAMDAVTFEPSIVQAVAGVGQITFKYFSDELLGNTTAQFQPSFTDEQLSSAELTLVHTSCLPGYFLREGQCICEETDVVALCVRNKSGIFLGNGLWGAPPNWSRELVTYTCPPGYCDCSQGFDGEQNVGCLLNYTNPDEICTEARQGLLCGQCRSGYGVGLLTNECKEFADRFPQFWLFPIYFAVLIPLLVVIVRFGVHLPTILRGFIFYIQISPIAVEFLPQSFRLRTDIMSCLSSTLALYVPYDFNFHQGMTSLESYGLRYVTPLVALIVVPIAAKVRRRRSKYWFGVWTVIQLMYIMAVNTSVSLLLCARLTRGAPSNPSTVFLWFYDGSVQCYRGWHILLAIIALLSLLALGIIIFFVIAALYFNVLHRKVHSSFVRLEHFSVALTKGFKKEYYWWPITELVCRYIFVISVVLSVGSKTVPLFLSVLYFLAQFYLHPYKDALSNYLESFVLFVLIVLLGLGNTTVLVDTVNGGRYFTLLPIYYLPVLVGLVTTVAYIVYQIWISCKQKKQTKKFSHSTVSRRYATSYRKHARLKVTKSVVSFEDGELIDAEEREGQTMVDTAADDDSDNIMGTQLNAELPTIQ